MIGDAVAHVVVVLALRSATCPQALSKNDRMATVRDQANKEARKGSDKPITRYARFEKVDATADEEQLDEQLAKVRGSPRRMAIVSASYRHRRVVR